MDEYTAFLDALRGMSGGNTDEDVRTTDLEFNAEQFRFAMLMEDDGERLLKLLQDGEWKVVLRMGLCTTSETPGGLLIQIPRWNNFISHLRIVSGVLGV